MEACHRSVFTPAIAGLLAILFSGSAAAIDLRSWDLNIRNGVFRFVVQRDFGDLAVLDIETQLVWTRDAGFIGQREWSTNAAGQTGAREVCANLLVANKAGWRLPSLHELSSLADVTHEDPTLPLGHPFQNVFGSYWTATTSAKDETKAWAVAFRAFYGANEISKDIPVSVWCVRGGVPGPDKY